MLDLLSKNCRRLAEVYEVGIISSDTPRQDGEYTFAKNPMDEEEIWGLNKVEVEGQSAMNTFGYTITQQRELARRLPEDRGTMEANRQILIMAIKLGQSELLSSDDTLITKKQRAVEERASRAVRKQSIAKAGEEWYSNALNKQRQASTNATKAANKAHASAILATAYDGEEDEENNSPAENHGTKRRRLKYEREIRESAERDKHTSTL